MFSLSPIKHCFDGAIPAGLASCSADGTPNVTYLSQVHQVDDSHIGLSFQFFNKTKSNINENPKASLLLIDPVSGIQYRLQLHYERTETTGSLFDRIKENLDAVASMSGMSHIFCLKGVDIYRVVEWESMEGSTVSDVAQNKATLEQLNQITQVISECDQLSILLDTTLKQLNDRLQYSNSMVFLLNPEGQSLYTIASHGYNRQGAGAEVELGEGIIGMAAKQRRPMNIKHLQRQNIMANAVRQQAEKQAANYLYDTHIELPCLLQPNSQLAVPIEAKQQLLGVLFLETEDGLGFSTDTQEFIGSIANHLGTAILLCNDEPAGKAKSTPGQGTAKKRAASMKPKNTALSGDKAETVKVRHYCADNSVFIDNDYLIKGVAGAILWRLLYIVQHQGRSEFSNRELRLDPDLGLPDIADNLEARLILLHRRLDDRDTCIKMEKTGRGRFRLLIDQPMNLLSVTSA